MTDEMQVPEKFFLERFGLTERTLGRTLGAILRKRIDYADLYFEYRVNEEIGLEDLSGHAIRGYTLGEKIGAGSFGVVYRGVQPLVARDVAIKIILPQYANQPDFIRRFEAEAQIVARLEHPHIVPLYDYWREPNVAFLVMRLLRGGNVHQAGIVRNNNLGLPNQRG